LVGLIACAACGDDAAGDKDTAEASDLVSDGADTAEDADDTIGPDGDDIASDTTVIEVGPRECDEASDCEALIGAPGECQLVACVSGQCVLRLAAAGADCDDHDPCTTDDACTAGVCGGAAADCDDGNACTLDVCVSAVGCVHVASAGACDDADDCTTGDSCSAGSCAGLAVPGCDGEVCGDGACTGQETCATCALDCSPLGLGTCGGGCNPAATTTTCAPNFACLPSPSGGQGACVGQATACDVNAQTGCGAGESCLPLAGEGIGGVAFVCAPGGARAADEACGTQDDCGPTLLCDDGACRAACDPASPACSGGGLCRDVSMQFGLATGALGACDPACGDGTCGFGETCASCADDCGGACDVCGDATCGATESCASCAVDCGLCRTCGNGVCQTGETCLDCPFDCGACALCGDDVCALSETCNTCDDDCGSCAGTCGDAECSLAENCTTCSTRDCGACPTWRCGNGVCDPTEDCAACASDCGACAATCGDGDCERGESCTSCVDCALVPGALCGAACDPGAATPSCSGNYACVPTNAGQLFTAALADGNAVCATGCTSDAQCGGGRCLPLTGLATSGVCGAACAPGAVGCSDGATCVPSPTDSDKGVCIADGVCNPFGGGCEVGPCVPLDGASELGVCLPGCHSGTAGCASGGSCLARSGSVWRSGHCIGQPTACDPAAQTGCAASETCVVIGGAGIGGITRMCAPR